MKKLLLALLILGSISASATQYCYDDAVFSASNLQEAIKKCDQNIDTQILDKFINKLQRVSPGYGIKLRNNMSKLYKFMHTDIHYKHIDKEDKEVHACIYRVSDKKFNQLKIAVMDAMVTCGL